jgi:hypothetical protein
MRMLTAALGAITAITLLSGCAYDNYDRYGYGYGNGNGYYGDRTYGDRYSQPNYYGRSDRDCWLDRDGYRHCVRR